MKADFLSEAKTGAVLKLFIVDDDPTHLLALRFNLQKIPGCQVYCYRSGKMCLQNLSELKPDVVILDYWLDEKGFGDELNGMDVLKVIRQQMPGTKVIIISGQKELEAAVNSIKAGAYMYVVKDKQTIASLKKAIQYLSGDPQNDRQEWLN